MPHPARLLSPALITAAAALAGCVDEPELAEETAELSVWQWTDDAFIPSEYSRRPVGLAPLGDRLHMVYANYQAGSINALRWSRFDGSSWTDDVGIGGATDSRPAMATHGGVLHLIYKPAGESRLVMKTSTGTSWSGAVTVGRSLGTTVPYNPSALSYDGKLYLTYCAKNDDETYVYIDRYDGVSWKPFHELPVTNANTRGCNSAQLAPMPDTGEVEIVFNIVGDGTSWMYRKRGVIGRSTTVWYQNEALPMRSKHPLSIVTCDGITHLVHSGNGTANELWWSYREGGDWVDDVRITNQWSDSGATLGCLEGNTTVMVHDEAGGNRLLQSIFGP